MTTDRTEQDEKHCSIVNKAKMTGALLYSLINVKLITITSFQVLSCEHLVILFVSYDDELNVFQFLTVGRRKL